MALTSGQYNGGPVQDEAAAGTVHYRVVRSQAIQSVCDAHGHLSSSTPYEEPIFSNGNIGAWGNPAGGNLTVGTPMAGAVPVTWLGRPGAQLQFAGSVNGAWQSFLATDGTNWTAGFSSTNGFVSATNWPASGQTFFRLVKP